MPTIGAIILALGALAVAIVSCEEGCDCSDDCDRREERRSRLDAMIGERRTWLTSPSGAAPRIVSKAVTVH